MSTQIAVIGGSGLYELFDENESETRDIETPYGPARVTIGTLAGRQLAFLTRHGVDHSVAPHLINFRANIWALASLGVRAIISSSAVGACTRTTRPEPSCSPTSTSTAPTAARTPSIPRATCST